MADTRGAPVTEAELQRIRDLHAGGATRNDIARALGRSQAVVSKYAAQMSLSFDRSAIQAATEARKADAKARRSELELLLLEDARRLRGQIWEKHEYREYGGKEFVLRKWTQDEPTPTDKLKLMQATGAAVDRSIRLSEHDKDSGVDNVKSVLADLGRALGITPPAPSVDEP
jgi:transposase